MDATNLPAGDYQLTIGVDPQDRVVETSDSDTASTPFQHLDVSAGMILSIGERGFSTKQCCCKLISSPGAGTNAGR